MPISEYLARLRKKVGHDLILIPSVTVLVFDAQRRVLLIRHREGGKWVAPGGAIEPYELPADAAVREMWEETGLFVQPARILGVYGGPEFHWEYRNRDKVGYVMIVFEANVKGGELVGTEDEVSEMGYFAEGELEQLPMAEWLKLVLADAFRKKGETNFRPPTWRPGIDNNFSA